MQWGVVLLMSQNIKTQILKEVSRGWKDGKTKIITNSLERPASWQQDFIITWALFSFCKGSGGKGEQRAGEIDHFSFSVVVSCRAV